MAGRHLRELLAAYRDGDDLRFRRAAQLLIEAEEAKRHVQLANELRGLLAAGGGRPERPGVPALRLPEPPKDRESAIPLADVTQPDRHLSDLVLSPELMTRLAELAAEVSHWDVLDAAGVPRRRRLLLHGPPGCGKTSIAAALAGDLGWPLVTVRTDSIMSSFLGETAANLRRVFEFAMTGAFVVLFDEFDSLGKLRDDPADHGELRRVVNAVLQLIDRYNGPSLLVAATNHEEILDGALWRRFDEVLHVAMPSRAVLEMVLTRTLMGRVESRAAIVRAARTLDGLPHAAAEAAAYDALRRALLDGRPAASSGDLDSAVSAIATRRWS